MIHGAGIRTERLLLRPLTVSDADEVWEWVSDERVAQYMVYPVYTQKEKVREWLLSLRSGEQSARERHFHFAEYGMFQKLDGSCPMRSMRYEGEYGG